MILTNREGYSNFDLPATWHAGRRPGLSALFRVKDEETWIRQAIESVIGWCDEIVVALQPCADKTPEILRDFGDRIKVCPYPFDSYPMGPGHDRCPADSLHATAYYYNWTLAQSACTHILKWDGDMIAMDWLGKRLRGMMAEGQNRIKLVGTDLVEGLRHVGSHPRCPTDGIVLVTPALHWKQAYKTQKMCEALYGQEEIPTKVEDAFVHLKWAKPIASAIKQWPKDWQKIPHFQSIYSRRLPVAIYRGEYPAALRNVA